MTEIPTKRTTKPSAKLRSTDNAGDMELTSHRVAHDRAIAAETTDFTPAAMSAAPAPKQKAKAPLKGAPTVIPAPGTAPPTANSDITLPSINIDSSEDDQDIDGVGRAAKRRILPESGSDGEGGKCEEPRQLLTGCLCIIRCS